MSSHRVPPLAARMIQGKPADLNRPIGHMPKIPSVTWSYRSGTGWRALVLILSIAPTWPNGGGAYVQPNGWVTSGRSLTS